MAVGMVMVQEFPCAGQRGQPTSQLELSTFPTLTNELVIGPRPWWVAIIMQSIMIDLEERQIFSSGLGTITGTLRQIVKHGTMMSIRPSIPLERDLRTGNHGHGGPSRGRQLVTGDVVALVGIWRDEPAVLVVRVPACGHLDLVCGLVVPVLEMSASKK